MKPISIWGLWPQITEGVVNSLIDYPVSNQNTFISFLNWCQWKLLRCIFLPALSYLFSVCLFGFFLYQSLQRFFSFSKLHYIVWKTLFWGIHSCFFKPIFTFCSVVGNTSVLCKCVNKMGIIGHLHLSLYSDEEIDFIPQCFVTLGRWINEELVSLRILQTPQ